MVAAETKLLHILLCLLVFLQFQELALSQDHTPHFIYNGFTGVNLHLQTATILPSGLLQLTNTTKKQKGYAFFPIPIKFNTTSSSHNSASSLSFSTQFVFAMVPEWSTLGGHGITFTFSPSLDFKTTLASQYLGLFNMTSSGWPSSHVFAVELDSIRSEEFDDINDNHIGVDVNGLKSIDSAPVSYFSDEEGENKSLKLICGNPMQVWIDYDAEEKQLNVTIGPTTIEKPSQPLLSTPLDLSPVMSDSMYVGFSSSTGSMASNHYILGWSFNRNGKAESLDLSKLPAVPHQESPVNKQALTIIILVIIIAVVLAGIPGAFYVIWRKKYEEVYEDWEEKYGPQRFSYRDLYKATKGFRDGELLGTGGFGSVYRGLLPSNDKEVAVKKISHDAKEGMRQFVAEIVSMGRLKHRNLVPLLGYCRRKGELLLVYEYMPNGSVDKFLFHGDAPNLNWAQRYQILRGAASALLYLHEEWEQVVLHRDLKASNIMLDADFNARLGDFGLAKFYDHGSHATTTSVVGTIGYLAPEVPRTGKATTSSDVFGFGAFMLEMACGRKPVDPGNSEEMVLVDWVLDWWRKGEILRTIDPRLEGNYVAQEAELVLKLGLRCSFHEPAGRPSMRQVVQYLDGDAPLPELPLDGATSGLPTQRHRVSGDVFLSFPATNEYADSAASSSSSDSILSASP